MDFQEFFLSLGMGKRLSPEEKEARLKAYMDRKAEKIAKRKARLEEIERRRKEREIRKKARRGPAEVSTDPIKLMKPFEGSVKKGDEVGFRWLGMVFGGIVTEISKEQAFRQMEGLDENEGTQEVGVGTVTYYECTTKNGNIYPVTKKDIVLKKINAQWQTKE